MWAIYQPDNLSKKAKEILEDASNELVVSHASSWELLAKFGRGKLLIANISVRQFMERINALGVEHLPIELEQIILASELPHHHSDPFDRILIAQAMMTEIPVLTADPMLGKYGVVTLW